MNASHQRTARSVAGFAIAGILAFGLGVWHAWADDFCMKWCHEGNCWKEGANCWEATRTTAVHTDTHWSMTGGGVLSDKVGDITWILRATCAKECQAVTDSRAMDNPPTWDISTCGGINVDDYTEAGDLRFCGEPGG
jgi:hypothetical protein